MSLWSLLLSGSLWSLLWTSFSWTDRGGAYLDVLELYVILLADVDCGEPVALRCEDRCERDRDLERFVDGVLGGFLCS